jgi:hypothetical protein
MLPEANHRQARSSCGVGDLSGERRGDDSAGFFRCIIQVQKVSANSAADGIYLKLRIDEPTGRA